jgi:hypothetical protein
MRLVSAQSAAQREHGARVPSALTLRVSYRRVLRSAFRDPVELGDLAVDGEALHVAGIAEGPEMGWALQRLLDAVLENPALNTVEGLLRLTAELRTRYHTHTNAERGPND